MSTTRPQRHVLGSALRRFGVIGLLVGIVSGVVATQFVERVSATSYTAQGSFLVPLRDQPLPDETVVSARPGSAYDASGLASNYAAIIGRDQQLLQALSERTGVDPVQLGQRIDAVALPSSSVIRVTFTSADEAPVVEYFNAMRDLFTAPTSPTSYVPAGNLVPLQLPEEATRRAGLAPVAPWVGGLAGLLLGLATAVVLERLLAQVRSAGDVRALVPWPVLELKGRVSPERYETLVLRALTGPSEVRRVAVATVAGTPAAAGADLTEQLRRAEGRLRRSGRLDAGQEPVTWEWLGRLLDDSTVERSVQDADAVVLAMRRRALLRPATGALQRLVDLAAEHVVVVLGTPRRSGGDHASSGGAGESSPEPSAATRSSGDESQGATVAAPAR